MQALSTYRRFITNDELVRLDARWQNHVSALDVDDAEESRVGTLRAWQVDYLQLNFLWHFVRQQNFIFRWFYARTLLWRVREKEIRDYGLPVGIRTTLVRISPRLIKLD